MNNEAMAASDCAGAPRHAADPARHSDPAGRADPIRHVILLMMENHSFDQMLGCFQQVYDDLDGIAPGRPPRFNVDVNGEQIFQSVTTERQVPLDPMHEHENVMRQLADGNGGFVRDFALRYPGSSRADRQFIMGYYPLDFLPGLHPLAHEFTICDRWFSSLPGPTWPNRFFALSGTSNGHVEMPTGIFHPDIDNAFFGQDQKTVFDCLDAVGKSWHIYYYDIPSSLLLTRQRRPENLARYARIDRFFEDAQGPEPEFPAFTFIEPKYYGVDQNDDHPPHNVMKAQKLIADVYNAVRSNPALWESTLLVVAYDEHGGFYDHVAPPAAVPPDDRTGAYAFDRLGVRVPALLVSPWVDRRVEKTVFDHTSLLKYLSDKWNLADLGNRVANANSLACALRFDRPARTDTRAFIRVSASDLVTADTERERWAVESTHQSAMHLLADLLYEEADRGCADAIDRAAEAAATELQPWTVLKARIGRRLIAIGNRLASDLESHKRARIARTSNVVERLQKMTGE